MEIPGKPPLFTPQSGAPAQADAQDKVASGSHGPGVAKDTVQISENKNEIKRMTSKVNMLPDVREDKVAELKRRIESGSYQIMNETVASRLIGETVENNAILNQTNKNDD